MKKALTHFLIFGFWLPFSHAQSLYFPPNTGTWETLNPSELNWCPEKLDSLQTYLGEENSKAFLILKDGRIVVEWYFDDFVQDSLWYWASAAKSLKAMLVGIAQQEGYLDLGDPVSMYLGSGWTDCSDTEDDITIRNQLTMTSGLDDSVPDNQCTLDTCLQCLAEPGTRWAYHNAPYTLLREVLESATGTSINIFYKTYLGNPIGAGGFWVYVGYNNLFISTPRDMARYGLLALAEGVWNGTPVLDDPDYFQTMVNTSQDLNKAYGYLWWLNGKGEHMLPGLQFVFPYDLIPNAPDDLYAALGKNDQKIYVVPSQNLVVVRMGNAAGGDLPALSDFDNVLWEKLTGLECEPNSSEDLSYHPNVQVYPNPAREVIHIRSDAPIQQVSLLDLTGRRLKTFSVLSNSIDIPASGLSPGLYFLHIDDYVQKVIVK